MKLFTQVLQDYRKGKLVDLATRKLNELVRQVDETNKAGEITIKIKVKPAKEGESSEKVLAATVSTKLPVPELAESIFYSDVEGDLHRVDPRQTDLKFEDANARTRAPATSA